MLTRKTIVKKTLQVGWFTLLSRFCGIAREMLMVRYLGAGAVSDAFLTAFKVPNSLRKIFAEGALSAAFVPVVVRKVSSGKQDDLRGIMSLAFLVFEGLVLALCAVAIWQAPFLIRLIAPGFSAEQIEYGVTCLRVLMPFIFFLSSSALIAGPLQALGHFFVPAFSPVLLNLVFIAGLVTCMLFKLPVVVLCIFILCGGLLQLIAHIAAYFNLGLSFGSIHAEHVRDFMPMLARFGLSLMSMSVMEINLFIDTSFASLLPAGSVSLLYYANRFMGIPLGVFAVALSTVLLPHFSRVSHEAPWRLSFYLLETAKLIWWVTLPIALLMGYFADDIFITLFLSKKFELAQAYEAGAILCVFLSGLFFFSLNKILLNVYYSFHVAWLPALIATGACTLNVLLDMVLVYRMGASGLALATVIAGVVQTIIFLLVLNRYFNVRFYGARLMSFMLKSLLQVLFCLTPVYLIHKLVGILVASLNPAWVYIVLKTAVLWFWVAPLCAAAALALWLTRGTFGIQLHFLDE